MRASKFAVNQDFFDTLFHHSHDGIGILSLDGPTGESESWIMSAVCYSEETLLAMNFYHLIHQMICNLQKQIQLMLDDQIKIYQSEHECFRKNNEAVWVSTTLSLVRDEKKSS